MQDGEKTVSLREHLEMKVSHQQEMRATETTMHQRALELSAKNTDIQMANLREKLDSVTVRVNIGIGIVLALQFVIVIYFANRK